MTRLSVHPFTYHPCNKLLRKILSRRRQFFPGSLALAEARLGAGAGQSGSNANDPKGLRFKQEFDGDGDVSGDALPLLPGWSVSVLPESIHRGLVQGSGPREHLHRFHGS